MKKIGIITIVIIACALVAGLIKLHLIGPTADEFVNHWGELFAQCNSVSDLKQISDVDRPDLIFVRKFDNGELIFARSEHACTSGAGYNATVFRDSSGAIYYDTSHHFCGYEGLCCELKSIVSTNLNQFYAGLAEDVELKPWTQKSNKILQQTAVND